VPGLCGARVLIVDDQREAREVAASVLQHHGASVQVAANAEQALAQFAQFDPNVLLIDLAMPDVDGYGLIERIRRDGGEKGKAVPAIAFTAYARDEDQRRALSNGFQMHLAKPVDSQRLVTAVASVQVSGSSAG
jgi:CheY-like chemotaxis protein